MGLFDLFKKKKKLKKSKASKEDLKKGVEALRKIIKAKNDKEFIEGMMKDYYACWKDLFSTGEGGPQALFRRTSFSIEIENSWNLNFGQIHYKK